MTANLFPFVQRDREAAADTVVFAGTSVPLRALFDHLQRGGTLEQFLVDFPTVGRHQAVSALQLAGDVLIAGSRSA